MTATTKPKLSSTPDEIDLTFSIHDLAKEYCQFSVTSPIYLILCYPTYDIWNLIKHY